MTDETRKVVRTDTGYRIMINSTRGTGVRDQDEVELAARTESFDELKDNRDELVKTLAETIKQLREIQPDD